MWQSREIDRKLFATDGSFPGFCSATTLACCKIFGIFLVSVQLLKKRSNKSRAFGSKLLDQLRLDVIQAGALPFFSRPTLIPMSSSAAVNGLVNPGSSGYRCRSRRTFGCLFGTPIYPSRFNNKLPCSPDHPAKNVKNMGAASLLI